MIQMNHNLMLLGYGVSESPAVLEHFAVADAKNSLNGVVSSRSYIAN
jgi:hypothetical protein